MPLPLLMPRRNIKQYFVIESKDAISKDRLSDIKRAKIHYGRERFKVLGEKVLFIVAGNSQVCIERAMSQEG